MSPALLSPSDAWRPAASARRRPRGELPRLLILLSLSVGIWFFAHSRITGSQDLSVDFRVVPPPKPDLVVLGEIPRTIKVTVRGPRARIDNLGDVRAWVNVKKEVRELQPFSVDLRKIQTNLPPEFTVSLSPDAPQVLSGLRLDHWEVRKVRIAAPLENEKALEAKGLRLGSPPYRIVPSHVSVRVPKSVGGGLLLKAAPVDLSRVAGPYHSESLTLEKSPEIEPLEPARIELNLLASKEKPIADVPVRILAPPGYPFRCVLEDRDRTIPRLTFVGDAATIQTLTAADVVAYVAAPDAAKAEPNVPYVEEVRFHLPKGVSLADPAPIRINVTLKEIPKEEAPKTVP